MGIRQSFAKVSDTVFNKTADVVEASGDALVESSKALRNVGATVKLFTAQMAVETEEEILDSVSNKELLNKYI